MAQGVFHRAGPAKAAGGTSPKDQTFQVGALLVRY